MQIRTDKTGKLIVGALTFCTLLAYALYRVAGLPSAPARAEASSWSHGLFAVTNPARPQPATKPAAKATSGAGEVTLTAQLDRRAVLSGSDGELHVALELRANGAAAADAARKPTDALVLLDVSGSMSGKKLDDAKQALHRLIERLGPDDRFGLVTYESEAQLVVPLRSAGAGAVPEFHRVVDRLATGGGTNMSAGLDLALAQLRGQRRSGASARVLLLSDGHANEGDASPAGLAARVREVVQLDDVLSALGIGDDFNEDLMTSLADNGAGNFYYLSRVELLGRYFDAELRAAAQTVASALELRFAPAPGVQLVALAGYPIERGERSDTVRPGNLYAGQERKLWATLRVPTDTLRDLALGSFSLQYQQGAAARELEAPPLPTLACVADVTRFERSIDRASWEEYVAGEQYTKVQAALGKAVGEGDEADIDREQRAYEQNRSLAEKLGSTRVLRQLDALSTEAAAAKSEQKAPAAERSYNAKQKKSRALFKLRRDAYNDDPLLGL